MKSSLGVFSKELYYPFPGALSLFPVLRLIEEYVKNTLIIKREYHATFTTSHERYHDINSTTVEKSHEK